jgi:hypothetical protein
MKLILIIVIVIIPLQSARAQESRWQAVSSGVAISSGSGQTLKSFAGQPMASGYSGFGVYQAQTMLSVGETTAKAPTRFQLQQNYPNPFNPTTIIKYQISALSEVRLELFDVLGRKVATLVDAKQNEGSYSVTLHGSKFALSSGTYFYRLQARSSSGEFVETRKMMLLK